MMGVCLLRSLGAVGFMFSPWPSSHGRMLMPFPIVARSCPPATTRTSSQPPASHQHRPMPPRVLRRFAPTDKLASWPHH